jgi:hypothetical protein
MLALRLFLPESWIGDRVRLERAGVPVECRTAWTKPEIALAEIDRLGISGRESYELSRLGVLVHANKSTFRLKDSVAGCCAWLRARLTERERALSHACDHAVRS